MGLTKRKDGYYVEFRVLDDGKTLTLARGVAGAKLRRWKTYSTNKKVADGEASRIFQDLVNGRIKSEQQPGPMVFKELTKAYLADPKIQRQVIYERKRTWIEQRFLPALGEQMPVDAITPERIEAYLEGRRTQEAAVATVNRELAGLKHLFSWAVKRRYLDKNPTQHIQQEKEDNVRDQILDPGQFETLQAHSPAYLRPIILVAYQTGMRRGEILGLTWEKVDLKAGFIRLKADDTKTRESRIIPLSPELVALFKDLQRTRALHIPQVFLRDGQPMRSMEGAFKAACKAAGITGFVFHDLRHTAITNMRRAGIDPLTIMQISGHKTMVCFTRYNSFREADLRAAVEKANTYLTLAHRKALEQVYGSAI